MAKKKYDNEHYQSLQVFLDKELVLAFKQLVNELSLSQADVIRYFVKSFMLESEKHVENMKQMKINTVGSPENIKSERELSMEKLRLSILEDKHKEILEKRTQEEIILYLQERLYKKGQYLELAEYLGLEVDKTKRTNEIFNALFFYYQKILLERQS